MSPQRCPMNMKRMYICVPKEERGLIEKVRTFFEKQYHKVLSEWQRRGGENGDLYEEIAQLDQYHLPNGGAVQLYTVKDHNMDGYAELVSVLFTEKDVGGKDSQELSAFLTALDFVTSPAHLRERPRGFHCFEGYLIEWYEKIDISPFVQS